MRWGSLAECQEWLIGIPLFCKDGVVAARVRDTRKRGVGMTRVRDTRIRKKAETRCDPDFGLV